MIDWTCKKFDELSNLELYKILQLRSQVFVVEQNCPYLDCDNKDLKSFHLCGWKDQQLIAYSRLLPAGISYSEPSIGRVCNSASVRGTGTGKALMKVAIEESYRLFGKVNLRIGAQLYLKEFYEEFGFVMEGDVYLEDNIDHIIMLKKYNPGII